MKTLPSLGRAATELPVGAGAMLSAPAALLLRVLVGYRKRVSEMSKLASWLKRVATIPISLLVAGCATIDWAPVNGPEAAMPGEAGLQRTIPSVDDGYVVGLSFSGGGTRAAAFAYGVLDGLRLARAPNSPKPLIDHIKFVSSVSGGSVTAAYYGLYNQQIFEGFEQKFLYADAEADLRTTIGPSVLSAAISGGVNDQTRLPKWFERHLFGTATVGDLLTRSPRIVLNATDVYSRVPFTFTYETFNAICSDPSSVPVADAVAASAAVPIAFVPVVLQVYKDNCKNSLPPWVISAAGNRAAAPKIRAMAAAWQGYRNDPDVNFLKLADGGITDNYGLSSVSTWLESLKHTGHTTSDLARIRRLLIIVVDAGQEQTAAWTRTASGSNGIALASAAIDTALDALARTNLDLFEREIAQWKKDAIASRCRLNRAAVMKMPGIQSDWRCDDLDVHVRRVSFDDLDATRARQLSLVSTRFSLPTEQVAAVIQAGRDVVQMAPWSGAENKTVAR